MRKSCSVLLLSALVACSPDDVNRIEGPPSPARIEAFSVSRLLVRPGDSVAIAWDVRNTNEVALFANEEELDIGGRTEGEITHVVEEETRFRLVAGPEGSRVSREILVGVRAPDDRTLILSFVPDPPLVDAGEPTRLAWVTRNATEVKILDENDEVVPLGDASAEQGSVEVRPDRNATYRLVATGKSGTAERSASVRVRGQPAVEAGVSKPSIVPGETVTLSWAVLDALRVVVREVGGPVLVDTELSMAGSVEVQPSRSTEYEVRGMGAWRDTVEILRVEVAPRILSFELEGEGPLAIGTLATLRWTTVGATRLYLSNLEGAEEEIGGYRLDEGSIRLPVGSEGRFLLRAVGGGGEEVEETVTTEVFGAPTIASFSVSPDLQSAKLQPVTVTVSWAGIENADRVRLETDTLGRMGIFDAPFEDGELSLFLTETTKFTLIAENEAGEARRTATATVVPLPRIHEFLVFPSHASVGEPVMIQWDVEHAAEIVIEWKGEPLPIDAASTGTHLVTAEEPGSFRIVASNSLGGTSERDQGLTIGAPQIIDFDADEFTMAPADPLTLTWFTLGGVKLTLLENGTPIQTLTTPQEIAQGSFTVVAAPMGTYEYTLQLENGLGEVLERSLTVVRTDGPLIEFFTVASNEICPGDAVELAWSATLDSQGRTPTVSLVVDGETIDLPGAQGSYSLKGLTTGSYVLSLVAHTPGTQSNTREASLEVGDETSIVDVSIVPEVITPGTDVTISWETTCAKGVELTIDGQEFYELDDDPYQDISPLGTLHTFTAACGTWGADDEGCTDVIFPQGFVFPFDGVNRTAARVFVNGLASLDMTFTGDTWKNDWGYPNSSQSWANFAVLWEDMRVKSSSPVTGVYSLLVGDAPARSLVIQWVDLWSLYTNEEPQTLDIQLVFHENGSFTYRYGTVEASYWSPGEYAVIGYQNAAATRSHVIADWSPVPGGLNDRTFHFGSIPRPANGSFTFRPTESRTVLLEAVGNQQDAIEIEVNVQ